MALKFLNDGYFAGKVGIGTESPATLLHLDQSSNDRAGGLYIERNASNYGLSMFVNSGGYGIIGSNGTFTTDILTLDLNSGNVGIGTTSPRYKLDLVTPQSTTQIADIVLPVNNSGDDSIGSSLMWKANYTGYTKRSAGIAHIAEGNFFRSGLAFYTNGSTSSTGDWAERMRIGMEGNVGIGTDNPLAKVAILTSGTFVLNSNGNDYSGVNIQMKTTNTAVNAIGSGIVWNKGASTRKVAAITNYIYGDADQSGLNFYVQPTSSGSSAVLTEAMRITNTGGISFGSTGTAYGGIGQVLTSAGNASPTWTTPTTGTVTGTGVTGEVAYWTSSTNIANNAGMSFSNEQLQLDGIGGADGFALPYDENPGYSNMSAGGFGILFREARDNYILGNAYWYKTGGTASWRAKYGAHAATMIGSDGGNITFETAPVNTTSPHTLTFSPKMVIKNGGNVGIGTTSPLDKLHVAGRVRTSSSGVAVGDTNAVIYRNSNDLELITYGGYDINLMPAGNVGIGTTNPTANLHISDTADAVLKIEGDTINSDETKGAKILLITDNGYRTAAITGGNATYETSSGNFNALNLQSKDIRFHTGITQDYDLAVERMRITGTGALSFGTTGTAYGTSGQILKSNGNASPTWIDGSAIPGVPAGSGTFKHCCHVDARW